MNLNEKLGCDPNDRLLIINADDFGMCHATNEAIKQLLDEKVISSATVMTPCPWAKEAVFMTKDQSYDIGVHLTFTSEWKLYKWGPLTRQHDCSSLVDQSGHFYPDCTRFEENAIEAQVKQEIIAQIEAARKLGLEPSHLDNHMGSLYGLATGRDNITLVLQICAQYGLPFRMPRRVPANQPASAEMIAKVEQAAAYADALGVVIIDDLVGLPFWMMEGETYETYKKEAIKALRSLRPGVSEWILHPSKVNEELNAIHNVGAKRGWDFDLFRDPEIKQVIEEEELKLIHWKQLKEVQNA